MSRHYFPYSLRVRVKGGCRRCQDKNFLSHGWRRGGVAGKVKSRGRLSRRGGDAQSISNRVEKSSPVKEAACY